MIPDIEVEDEWQTRQLANDIALILKPGDALCLSGDLGAGKSTFARSLIRALADDDTLEVPSPTFTLVQTYDLDRLVLSHFDLYRLEEPEEIDELGLDELLVEGAVLVEWPEKAEAALPANALWIRISHAQEAEEKRIFQFSSNELSWKKRLEATLDVRTFLEAASFEKCRRNYLAGDASLRQFEKIEKENQTSVLMLWPFQANDLPGEVRAYMQRAHLATDCRSVVAIGSELRSRGFGAPEIYAADLQQGFVLSQYLGSETIVSQNKPVRERYLAAVDVLARMHSLQWPDEIVLSDSSIYQVPEYSNEALIAEASLFLEWFVPYTTQGAQTAAQSAVFKELWQQALDAISDAQRGWVLRDFHSPNLLWQEKARAEFPIGLIDFQDTVVGPVAYDVGSLLFDARTDINPDLETELFKTYIQARQKADILFDQEAFSKAYAVMSAQRISKILGIFVRLAQRDLKPGYLSHLPRMLDYLNRVLQNPILSDLKDWYQSIGLKA